MAKKVFVSLDGGPTEYMQLNVTFRRIPKGTETHGRLCYPFGRGHLIRGEDPIPLRIVEVCPKAVGNATLYRAERLSAKPEPAPSPKG
jgi:hypothetical protein